MKQDKKQFGIIIIDKPSGPTSFTISDYVRKKLNLNKTSHMGTLDPKVTGVLPITLGKACRLAGFIISHDKTYVGILHTHKEQNKEHLQTLINQHFVGRIKQTPPHKSAVKRVERQRTVHYFRILEEHDNHRDFLFETKVEGGTYIRKLCSDLGELIGGAHMDELRRTQAGIFTEQQAITMQEFDELLKNQKKFDEKIIPAEEILPKIMKTTQIKKQAIFQLHHGKPLLPQDLNEKIDLNVGEHFAAYHDQEIIGIYQKTKEKGIFAKAVFVNV